jgi:hypothetical protein
VEASVEVEAKMEREETSTSDIGPEFSIDFRQELALKSHASADHQQWPKLKEQETNDGARLPI